MKNGFASRTFNFFYMFLIAVPLFTGLIINSTTIKLYHKKEKTIHFTFRVCRPVDEVAPRCPCKHADGTVHASTKSQPSSPHPPGAEIWTAKVLSARMREVSDIRRVEDCTMMIRPVLWVPRCLWQPTASGQHKYYFWYNWVQVIEIAMQVCKTTISEA